MSDPRTSLASSSRELAAEEAQREERHQKLATLLGAFADGELPAETASQIDAHLLGCPRCRREVTVHRTLRLRLEQEPLAPASATFRDRVMAAVAATPAPAPRLELVAADASSPAVVSHEPTNAVAPSIARRVGRNSIAVVVVLVLAFGAVGGRWLMQRNALPSATIVSAASVPLFSAALEDYRRVAHGDLPGRARDLASVREAMPFPVQAIQSPSLRLLAVWSTNLNGEPAAVIAYRWKDAVVLQYLISELQLYRSAEGRGAFANGRLLAARDGSQNIIAWPDPASGSLLVGDIPLSQLEELRAVAQK